MTQSTVEPKALKLWKLEPTDEGLRLHISAHWNVSQSIVEDDHGSRQEWEYEQIRFIVPYEGTRDSVDAFLVAQEARLLLIAKTLWEAKHDAPALTTDEAKELADYATQERIRTALHPVAGSGEEIKILREQLKEVMAKTATKATSDFVRLDGIATTEILKAYKEI
jgi:hypothetical protein